MSSAPPRHRPAPRQHNHKLFHSVVAVASIISLACMASAATESSADVALHDLPGNALHVRASHTDHGDIYLTPASAYSPSPSSSSSGKKERRQGGSNFKQYYVRVVNDHPAELYAQLVVVAKGNEVNYIPENTFITALDDQGVADASNIPGVTRIYHVPKSVKKTPRGNRRLEATDGTGTVTIDAQILSGPQVAQIVSQWQSLITAHAGSPAELRIPSPGKVVVEIAEGDAADKAEDWLVEQEEVVWVEQRSAIRPLNKYAGSMIQDGTQTGSEALLWRKGIRGQGQVVGVGDTGLDYDSCFFRDDSVPLPWCKITSYGDVAPTSCINMNHRKIVSYRAYPRGDVGDYFQGHGTHVAGSIAGAAQGASTSQLDFASNYNGVAVDAKIAFDDIATTGEYLYPGDDLSTELFPHAALAEARLHSNSWGGMSNEYTSYSREMDQYTHDVNDDFLILVAAGNAGSDSGSIGTPATAKNILSVGAGGNTATAYAEYGVPQSYRYLSGQVVDFSSRGPTADGRIKPDVVCPGHYIMSASSDGDASTNQCGSYTSSNTRTDGAITLMSGTSMATPTCAGGAALVRQYFLEGWHATGTQVQGNSLVPSAALVKATMIHSGQKMQYKTSNGAWVTPSTLPHQSQGFGSVDLSKVLYFQGESGARRLYVQDREEVSQGGESMLCYDVEQGTQFKVTLVWTDPPASLQASKALVHDLDLVVEDPSGSSSYGNSWGSADRLNNAEQLTFDAPLSGMWKVSINGHSVATGSQQYALVVTGDAVPNPTCGASPPPSTPAPTPAPETTPPSTTPPPTPPPSTTPPSTPPPSTTPPSTPAPGKGLECSDTSVSFSGHGIPDPVPFTTGAGRVVFQSDHLYNDMGILAAYGPSPVPSAMIATSSSPLAEPLGKISTNAPGTKYSINTDESIVISPQGATQVHLYVTRLDVERNYDFVYVDECSDQACSTFTTISSLTGYAAPSAPIVSQTPHMRLRFVSDYSITYDGFSAVYSGSAATQCTPSGSPVLTSTWGLITDGAGSYEINTRCEWDIASPGLASVSFHQFATEAGYDFVTVRECTPEGEATPPPETTTPPPATTTPNPTPSPTPPPTTTPPPETTTPPPATTTPNPTPSPTPPPTTTPPPETTTPPPATTTPNPTPSPTPPPTTTPPPATTTPAPGTCSSYSDVASLSGAIPPPVTVNSLPMRIAFTSDSSVRRQGFVGIWSDASTSYATTACTNGAPLTAYAGLITDGPGKYSNGESCTWMIAPEGASEVTLKFLMLNTEEGFDKVHVDSCIDAACSQVSSTQVLSGLYGSPPEVTSSTPWMRVTFTSDGSVTRAGFEAVYTGGSVHGCEDVSSGTLSQPMGVMTDGDGKYPNWETCEWIVSPSGSSGARLEFVEFQTEGGYDIVSVEECSSTGRRAESATAAAGLKFDKSTKHEHTKGGDGALEEAIEEAQAVVKILGLSLGVMGASAPQAP